MLAVAGGSGGQSSNNEVEPSQRAVLIVGHQPTLGRAAALRLSGVETEWSIKKGVL